MENQKDPKIVVCDLDGTLVSTDIFHESLLRAIAADITIFLISVIRFLVTGRPAAKKYLAENTELDVDALPFNEQVLSYLHKKKQLGCRLFLVSAADKKIVNKISSHLNIFEEAHGSSEGINLKGEQKADFLLKKFGKNRFEYIGNSTADFHVWRISAKATAVGFSRTRLAKLKRINVNTISIEKLRNERTTKR